MVCARCTALPWLPAGGAVAAPDRLEQARHRTVGLGTGVRAGDEQARMVVGAPHQRFAPGNGTPGLEAVFGGEARDAARREVSDQVFHEAVPRRGARAVAHLKNLEQQQDLLHRVGRQAPVHGEQRGWEMKWTTALAPVDQLVDAGLHARSSANVGSSTSRTTTWILQPSSGNQV